MRILLEVIRDATLNNDNLIYVEQKFGGHLVSLLYHS